MPVAIQLMPEPAEDNPVCKQTVCENVYLGRASHSPWAEHSKILLELIRSETQPRRLFCNTEMEINATFFVQTLLYICCENVYLSRAKYAVLLSYLSRWSTLLKPSDLSSTICSFIFAFNLHVCWIDYRSESVSKQLFKTCNDEAQHYLQLIMLFF